MEAGMKTYGEQVQGRRPRRLEHISKMTPSRGRGVPEARRTQPSRIVAHDHSDEGGVLAVRRPKSCGRTPGTRTKLGEAERRFWRGGRPRRPQQAAFLKCALLTAAATGPLAPPLPGSCRPPGAPHVPPRP